MAKSHSPRSVKYLRKMDWPLVDRVECVTGYYSKDLLGFIDVWAFDPQRGHLFVQVTSRGHISTRKKKIFEDHWEDARMLLAVKYNRLVIQGWDKYKNRWRVKEVDITDEILAYRSGDKDG